MNLPYFINGFDNGMNPTPNDGYRQLQQARIDDQWTNTSARYPVKEQDGIGANTYTDIDVWIDFVVNQGSTGYKNGEDFRQLAFQSIEHPCIRGTYYQFNDNYWIAYFTDEYNSLTKTLAVRRCNNFLRWVNPLNGNIEAVPCVVDYDMASPSVQVTGSILTPNNHATVMIQGNDLTLSQLQTNMRFILGNRPFKLFGYQNTMLDDLTTPSATLLYLDLYLDEKQANDNFVTGVAFNGYYNYTITPSQLSIDSIPNSTGKLSANVLLNGNSVTRPLVWQSSDLNIITIDSNGNFVVHGNVGQTATIKVGIEGNTVNMASIPVTVVDTIDTSLDVYITPTIIKIRQHETINFVVNTNKQDVEYDNFTSTVSLDQNQVVLSNKYLTINNISLNSYNLNCTAFNSTPQVLYITVTDNATHAVFNKQISINTVSMFG